MTDPASLSNDEIEDRIPRAGRDFWKGVDGRVPHDGDKSGLVYEDSEYANLVAEARRRGLDRPAI